jgi:electron transfer flavoprotein beta subunit
MLQIVVCVKQVPDTTEVRIDPETNTLVREGVPAIVNPFDAHATEAAAQLKEIYGAHVTVLSMGPPQAVEAIKKCVTMGVDRGILLSDRAFAGADTWATSYALAAGLAKIAAEDGLDLVLCGKQAIDGDTAQVGPGLARRLGWPQITYAIGIPEVDVENRTVTVERRLEGGVEVVRARLPAVITVVEEINELRYAPLPDMIRASRYEPEVWTKDDLEVEDSLLGLKGSPTAVDSIFPPPQPEAGEIIAAGADDPAGSVRTLVEKLVQRVEAGTVE